MEEGIVMTVHSTPVQFPIHPPLHPEDHSSVSLGNTHSPHSPCLSSRPGAPRRALTPEARDWLADPAGWAGRLQGDPSAGTLGVGMAAFCASTNHAGQAPHPHPAWGF